MGSWGPSLQMEEKWGAHFKNGRKSMGEQGPSRFVPESSRQTLVSPIFRSRSVPSVALFVFRKCRGDKSATLSNWDVSQTLSWYKLPFPQQVMTFGFLVAINSIIPSKKIEKKHRKQPADWFLIRFPSPPRSGYLLRVQDVDDPSHECVHIRCCQKMALGKPNQPKRVTVVLS